MKLSKKTWLLLALVVVLYLWTRPSSSAAAAAKASGAGTGWITIDGGDITVVPLDVTILERR